MYVTPNPEAFRFRLVFDLSFALRLSKGRPFMVRQAHHERTTLVTLNNEKSLTPNRDFCAFVTHNRVAEARAGFTMTFRGEYTLSE